MKDNCEVKSLHISSLNYLISGGMDGSVKYWDYENNFAPFVKIQNHTKVVHTLLELKSGILITASEDQYGNIYDIENQVN